MNHLEETESSNPFLEFSPLALADIKETWEYLSERSEDAAKEVIRSIIKKCGVLSRNPKIGRERNDLMIHLRIFPFKNYNIYYFPTETGVEIYRVLHASRDVIQIFDEVIDETE